MGIDGETMETTTALTPTNEEPSSDTATTTTSEAGTLLDGDAIYKDGELVYNETTSSWTTASDSATTSGSINQTADGDEDALKVPLDGSGASAEGITGDGAGLSNGTTDADADATWNDGVDDELDGAASPEGDLSATGTSGDPLAISSGTRQPFVRPGAGATSSAA